MLAKNNWYRKRKASHEEVTGDVEDIQASPTMKRKVETRNIQPGVKTNIAKKSGEVKKAGKANKAGTGKAGNAEKSIHQIKTVGVMFVEQTAGGELAKRLQQA